MTKLTDDEILDCMKMAYATAQGRNLEVAFARAVVAAHEAKQPKKVLEAWTNLLAYVLQDDLHNRLTPRVIDIAHTAFMLAKQPNTEDGGASDWFTDTKPKVDEMIAKLRKDLIEERGSVPVQDYTSTQPPFGSKRKAAMAVYKPPFKYLHGYIYDSQDLMVADDSEVEGAVAARIRGWGRLSYLPNGAELQDEIGQMVADALNFYFEVEGGQRND